MIDKVNDLFYSFHSEFEAIVMDLIADRIDKALFDLMFSDFDSLQEEYHDKLKTLFVSDQATQQIP